MKRKVTMFREQAGLAENGGAVPTVLAPVQVLDIFFAAFGTLRIHKFSVVAKEFVKR